MSRSERPKIQKTPAVVDLRIARVLRVIEQQPERGFRVRELAKLAGASRASFMRLFVSATGVTPIRYLTERRLERAAALVATSPLTLAEIARRTGYANEFSLSRAFKRRYGAAPAFFRAGVAPARCAA